MSTYKQECQRMEREKDSFSRDASSFFVRANRDKDTHSFSMQEEQERRKRKDSEARRHTVCENRRQTDSIANACRWGETGNEDNSNVCLSWDNLFFYSSKQRHTCFLGKRDLAAEKQEQSSRKVHVFVKIQNPLCMRWLRACRSDWSGLTISSYRRCYPRRSWISEIIHDQTHRGE